MIVTEGGTAEIISLQPYPTYHVTPQNYFCRFIISTAIARSCFELTFKKRLSL